MHVHMWPVLHLQPVLHLWVFVHMHVSVTYLWCTSRHLSCSRPFEVKKTGFVVSCTGAPKINVLECVWQLCKHWYKHHSVVTVFGLHRTINLAKYSWGVKSLQESWRIEYVASICCDISKENKVALSEFLFRKPSHLCDDQCEFLSSLWSFDPGYNGTRLNTQNKSSVHGATASAASQVCLSWFPWDRTTGQDRQGAWPEMPETMCMCTLSDHKEQLAQAS